MSTVKIQHPSIGDIEGLDGDGVYQFLGVQYATVKDRLAESQVKTAYEGPVDATRHGPSSYSPATGFANEMVFIQQALPAPKIAHSDLECLNLNITVPKTQHGVDLAKQKFPVFVWTHGGGFVLGANSWPQYDHARLVKLASDNGVPVIGVGINFRLGLAGLLTSEELRQKGYKSNNMLRDQRNAFRWVKQYIAGFGGDPENITAIGESAGAVATTLHLYSEEKLYNRAIATGGSCLLIPPSTAEDQERTYQQVLTVLGLDKLEPEQRIQQLLTLPLDEAIAKLPPYIAFSPLTDGDIVPCRPTYAAIADPADQSMPGKQWTDGLAIGDSQFDGSIMGFMLGHLKPGIRQAFSASIRSTFASKPQVAETLLDAYGFTKATPDPKEDDEAAFLGFLHFVNDIGYYAATTSFARGWPQSSSASTSKIFPYFFNEPNPWPGPYTGEATHILDVAFLFQNYNDKLPPAQRAAAEGFGLDLMKFVAGQAPWEGYTPEKRKAKVFGPSKGEDGQATTAVIEDAESAQTGRRLTILELGKEVGFDKLAEAFGRFQKGL